MKETHPNTFLTATPKLLSFLWVSGFCFSVFIYLPFTQLLPRLLLDSSSWQVILQLFIGSSLITLLFTTTWLVSHFYFSWTQRRFKKGIHSRLFWPNAVKECCLFLVLAAGSLLPVYLLQKTFLDLDSGPQQFRGLCVVQKDGKRRSTDYYLLPLKDRQFNHATVNLRQDGIYITKKTFQTLAHSHACQKEIEIAYFSHLRVLWKVK